VVFCLVDRKGFDLSQASVTFIFGVHQLNVLFLTDGPRVWTKHAPSKRRYLFTRGNGAVPKKTTYCEIQISQLCNIIACNNFWNQLLISH
jgi:hypothetical protein